MLLVSLTGGVLKIIVKFSKVDPLLSPDIG